MRLEELGVLRPKDPQSIFLMVNGMERYFCYSHTFSQELFNTTFSFDQVFKTNVTLL